MGSFFFFFLSRLGMLPWTRGTTCERGARGRAAVTGDQRSQRNVPISSSCQAHRAVEVPEHGGDDQAARHHHRHQAAQRQAPTIDARGKVGPDLHSIMRTRRHRAQQAQLVSAGHRRPAGTHASAMRPRCAKPQLTCEKILTARPEKMSATLAPRPKSG